MSNHGCAWFTPGNVKIDPPSGHETFLRPRERIWQVKNLIALRDIPRRPPSPEFHLIAPHYGVFWMPKWSKKLRDVDEYECRWAAVVFTADAGTILISRYFVDADMALNGIRIFLLAYGAKDPALERPDLPWDMTIQQPRLYGPELFYLLCILKRDAWQGYVDKRAEKMEAWFKYRDSLDITTKSAKRRRFEELGSEALQSLPSHPDYVDISQRCGKCPNCRMAYLSGDDGQCYRRIANGKHHYLRGLRWQIIEKVEEKVAMEVAAARSRAAPSTEHDPVPKPQTLRQVKWFPPLPKTGGVLSMLKNIGPVPLVLHWHLRNAGYHRKRSLVAKGRDREVKESFRKEQGELDLQQQGEWGTPTWIDVAPPPVERDAALPYHWAMLEAARGAEARGEPLAELPEWYGEPYELNNPDPTPASFIHPRPTFCMLCRSFKKSNEAKIAHKSERENPYFVHVCPVDVMAMASWEPENDDTNTKEPEIADQYLDGDADRLYQPFTQPTPWLSEIRPPTRNLMEAFKEVLTGAVHDFNRQDLQYRLSPNALLAAGLLLEESAAENARAVGGNINQTV